MHDHVCSSSHNTQQHDDMMPGDARHGLYHRPWPPCIRSSAMHQFTTSWVTPCTLCLFYIALRGVLCHFLSVHFKVNFHQSGVTSSAASAAAHGSLPSVPVQCACLLHHVQFLAHSVCFIWQLGLLGAPKCNPLRNR